MATTIRIGTFNCKNSMQANSVDPGDLFFPSDPQQLTASEAILARINLDMGGIQEVFPAFQSNWTTAAANLGYARESPGVGVAAFKTEHFNDLLTRSGVYTVVEQGLMDNVATWRQQTAIAPVYSVLDISGSLLVVGVVHLTSYLEANNDQWTRAVGLQNVLDWMSTKRANLRALGGGIVEMVLMGDFNTDPDDSMAGTYPEEPAGPMPTGYVSGACAFPVVHGQFPQDAIAPYGFTLVPAYREGGTNPDTYESEVADWTADDLQLDYIAITNGLVVEGAEVYDSTTDAGGGLSKVGVPPPPESSTQASDHLVTFADVTIQ